MPFTLGPEVRLDRPAYLDPTARLYGRVSAGEGSSFWPYSVIRAEGAGVTIGRCCNVQDTAVIHVGGGRCVLERGAAADLTKAAAPCGR